MASDYPSTMISNPHGMAFTADGALLLVDEGTNLVLRLDADGQLLGIAAGEFQPFARPLAKTRRST